MFKNLSPSALGISGHQSEIIELALTFGFAGMDLAVADFSTRAKLRGMDYARRLIDSARVKLGSFELPLALDADDETFKRELGKLPEYAKAASEVGCTRCVVTLAPADDQRPYHENFEFHRRRMGEVCGALQPAGICLGVGFLAPEYLRKNRAFQFIHDLDALSLLLNMVDAPNIGVLLDVWDLVACGRSVDSIRQFTAKQIIAVQVADMPADVHMDALDANSRLLPGGEGGQIDVAGALTILSGLGYDGPVSVKPSRTAVQGRRRDLVAKQAGEALTKVWRAAGMTSSNSPVIPSRT